MKKSQKNEIPQKSTSVEAEKPQKVKLATAGQKRIFKGVWGVVSLLVGAVALVLPFFVQVIADNSVVKTICFVGGGIFFIVGVFILFTANAHASDDVKTTSARAIEQPKKKKRDDDDDDDEEEQPVVNYIPQESVFQFMKMGLKQPIEEKFDQIYKMDHTQFVMYIARLFAARGYTVKLTPVVDNFDVDMIVEKNENTMGVSCINRNKALVTRADVETVAAGKGHYDVKSCMALTSGYFDKTAMDYIKENKLAAVDRTILEEDFIDALERR